MNQLNYFSQPPKWEDTIIIPILTETINRVEEPGQGKHHAPGEGLGWAVNWRQRQRLNSHQNTFLPSLMKYDFSLRNLSSRIFLRKSFPLARFLETVSLPFPGNGSNARHLYRCVKCPRQGWFAVWGASKWASTRNETSVTFEGRRVHSEEESCSHWLGSVPKFLTAESTCVQSWSTAQG